MKIKSRKSSNKYKKNIIKRDKNVKLIVISIGKRQPMLTLRT